MDYTLAKQLKDAGFPQHEADRCTFDNCSCHIMKTCKRCFNCDGVYVPTLSELIETCDDSFTALYKGNRTEWFAEGLFVDERYEGDSPEEAVAHLWLALPK